MNLIIKINPKTKTFNTKRDIAYEKIETTKANNLCTMIMKTKNPNYAKLEENTKKAINQTNISFFR